MTRVSYREAVGAFVVFDCTRPRTFDSVRLQSIVWRRVMLRRVSSFCAAFGSAKICMLQVTKWKQDIDQKVLDSSGKPVPVVLLMVKPPRRRGLCVRAVESPHSQNKCDLARDPSIPSGEALQQFVTDNRCAAVLSAPALACIAVT